MCHLSQNTSICKIIRFCIAYIMFGCKTDNAFFLETNIGNSVVQVPCVDGKDYQRSSSGVMMRLFHVNRFNSQVIYPGHDDLHKAAIAQWLEHWSCKPGVVSSILTGGCLSCVFNINKRFFFPRS